jgi:hypothetical protein
MRYTVKFHREIITHETVEREIEADDHDELVAKAREMADEFNSSCPDDAVSDGLSDHCCDWRPDTTLARPAA